MTYTIAVRILDKENTVKYVPFIRKWTKQPIASIRDNILAGEDALVSEYIKNPQSLIDLRKEIRTLQEHGAEVEIVMNTSGYLERIDLKMIDILIQTSKEIDEEIAEIRDLETRETEDDF